MPLPFRMHPLIIIYEHLEWGLIIYMIGTQGKSLVEEKIYDNNGGHYPFPRLELYGFLHAK